MVHSHLIKTEFCLIFAIIGFTLVVCREWRVPYLTLFLNIHLLQATLVKFPRVDFTLMNMIWNFGTCLLQYGIYAGYMSADGLDVITPTTWKEYTKLGLLCFGFLLSCSQAFFSDMEFIDTLSSKNQKPYQQRRYFEGSTQQQQQLLQDFA